MGRFDPAPFSPCCFAFRGVLGQPQELVKKQWCYTHQRASPGTPWAVAFIIPLTFEQAWKASQNCRMLKLESQRRYWTTLPCNCICLLIGNKAALCWGGGTQAGTLVQHVQMPSLSGMQCFWLVLSILTALFFHPASPAEKSTDCFLRAAARKD